MHHINDLLCSVCVVSSMGYSVSFATMNYSNCALGIKTASSAAAEIAYDEKHFIT